MTFLKHSLWPVQQKTLLKKKKKIGTGFRIITEAI